MPPEGVAAERYFGEGRLEEISKRLGSMGAAVGLTLEQSDRIINSRLALAAAEFARDNRKFEAMHHALFESHWHRAARLDQIEDLKQIGVSVGLDGDALEAALAEGRYGPLLDRHREEAEAVGINAIPAHIFGRRYLILGAQPMEVFDEVLAELART